MTARKYIVSLLTLLMMGSLTWGAQAQSMEMPTASDETPPLIMSPTWTAHFGEQMAVLLKSDIPVIREQGLATIIVVANHPGTTVDLQPAIAGLTRIYERDRRDEHRMMALVALHAIRDDESMKYLAEQAKRWERSERVRRLLNAILVDYFGA